MRVGRIANHQVEIELSIAEKYRSEKKFPESDFYGCFIIFSPYFAI